jgi:hypothetical protein
MTHHCSFDEVVYGGRLVGCLCQSDGMAVPSRKVKMIDVSTLKLV